MLVFSPGFHHAGGRRNPFIGLLDIIKLWICHSLTVQFDPTPDVHFQCPSIPAFPLFHVIKNYYKYTTQPERSIPKSPPQIYSNMREWSSLDFAMSDA